MLHYAGVGFQEGASFEPACACVIVCVAVHKRLSTPLSPLLISRDARFCFGNPQENLVYFFFLSFCVDVSFFDQH